MGSVACPAVPLEERIARDVPAFRRARESGDSRGVLRGLRQWVCLRGLWSSADLTLDALGYPVPSLGPAEFLDAFDARRGGATCGTLSIWLCRLYRAFGYPACTLNVGLPNPMTHMMTLVEDPSGCVTIQDPTFNGTYADAATGEPLPVETLFGRLARGGTEGIAFVEDLDPALELDARILVSREWLTGLRYDLLAYALRDDPPLERILIPAGPGDRTEGGALPHEAWLFRRHVSYARFLERYGEALAAFVMRCTGSPAPAQLLRVNAVPGNAGERSAFLPRVREAIARSRIEVDPLWRIR